MHTHAWPEDLLHYKLKTKRQKRRLVVEDRNKQLLRLNERLNELDDLQSKLTMVPLQEPYQRGWKRMFVLTDNTLLSGKADFYLRLLEKINTVEYCKNKSFRKRCHRRKKRKWQYEDIPQVLQQFDHWQWSHSKFKLTEKEKEFFHTEKVWSKDGRQYSIRYVFNEPWRYRLQVMPHIITETKMMDNVLAQEIGEMDYYIKSRDLQPLLHKLTKGRSWKWWGEVCNEKSKYSNPFKNKTLHAILDECIND